MKELIQSLALVVLRRNPILADKFQPGLSDQMIRTELKRAGIEGVIDPIVEMYSWRNGTILDRDLASSKTGFLPEPVYQFTELKRAIVDRKGFKDLAHYHPRLSVLVGRYFPFLWDGSDRWIALDVDFSAHSRIVMIQDQEAEPLREAYGSFVDFLKDAIRANEGNQPLSCFKRNGPCIPEILQDCSGLSGMKVAKLESRENEIPMTENTLVLRTDFSDESAWQSLCAAIQNPADELSPCFDLVSDSVYANLGTEQLPALLSDESSRAYAFIVDRVALTSPEHPILAVDLHDKPGRAFRVASSALAEVEFNLSISNMDFEEFANAVDKDGIFRGFGGS